MKKWIRWKGILAFVVIMVLCGVFFKFYAGILVEKTIEFAGSKAVGARVDLADVDLSLFPLGITLKGLQVTDPDEPMTNLFEVATTRFSVEPGALLLRKVIIDEMAIDDLRLKTARQQSGELPKKEKKKSEEKKESKSGTDKAWDMPSFEIADVKSVLAKEPLASVAEADALKKDIEKIRTDFETRFMALPDKETFEGYEDRLKKIKSGKVSLGNILGKADELKQLKKDVDKDLDTIKTMKKDLKRTVTDYQARIKQLPQMALADVKRLKDKYALSPQGMGNVSALFFGQKSSAWVEKGLSWYLKLKPYLKKSEENKEVEKETPESKPERGKGVYVTFKENQPLPGFLVKHADLSLNLDSGKMTGVLKQVTNEQPLTGQPMTIGFTGSEMKSMAGLTLSGVMDRVNKDVDKDQVTLSIKGLNINDMALASGSAMGVRMEKSLANMDLNLKITGNNLEGTLETALGPMTLSPMNPDKNDRLNQAMAKALADVKSLAVHATISGTLDHYKVDLNSDLDRIIKKAVEGIIKDLSEEFSKELTLAIQDKAQGQVKNLTDQLDLFSHLDNDLEKRLDIGKGALKGL